MIQDQKLVLSVIHLTVNSTFHFVAGKFLESSSIEIETNLPIPVLFFLLTRWFIAQSPLGSLLLKEFGTEKELPKNKTKQRKTKKQQLSRLMHETSVNDRPRQANFIQSDTKGAVVACRHT